jgi:hypothetical protein
MKAGRKNCPIREAYILRFGIPRTNRRVRWLTAPVLQQLGRCKTDEARRLLLGVSK